MSLSDQPTHCMVVAGASANDGKSLTAANIAAAYAKAGNRFSDPTPRSPSPEPTAPVQAQEQPGSTTALRSDDPPLENLLQATALPNLHVLTSGPLPPNPAELLGSKRMKEIFAKLITLADLVIVDSPPLTTVTDGLMLATQADGVLPVVRAGATRRGNTKRSRHC